MNGNGEGRVQKFNQTVRSIITLALVGGFLWGFLVTKNITPEIFSQLVVLAVTWWLTRDSQSAAAKEATEALKTPPPPSAPAPKSEEPKP